MFSVMFSISPLIVTFLCDVCGWFLQPLLMPTVVVVSASSCIDFWRQQITTHTEYERMCECVCVRVHTVRVWRRNDFQFEFLHCGFSTFATVITFTPHTALSHTLSLALVRSLIETDTANKKADLSCNILQCLSQLQNKSRRHFVVTRGKIINVIKKSACNF